jgi:hypothetical protein
MLGVERIVEMLIEGPPRLRAAMVAVPDFDLQQAPGPGEWSAVEVLAHLRACADQWGGSALRILSEDRPAIRAINPRTWVERTDYREQAFSASLRAFTAQRDALVAALRDLDEGGWARSATVTGAGKGLERSVHMYAQWLAEHERPHMRQIERIAGTLSADDGPALGRG